MASEGNGKYVKELDNDFLGSLSDEELMLYLKDMSSQMERLCHLRGYQDLARVFALARDWAARPKPPH